MGELKDKAKGIGNKIAGNAKQVAGDVTNDPELQAEGKLQEAKGGVQEAVGTVKGAFGNKV